MKVAQREKKSGDLHLIPAGRAKIKYGGALFLGFRQGFKQLNTSEGTFFCSFRGSLNHTDSFHSASAKIYCSSQLLQNFLFLISGHLTQNQNAANLKNHKGLQELHAATLIPLKTSP